jgi:serine phosphatase RsbU (regulator of sigma subunit)
MGLVPGLVREAPRTNDLAPGDILGLITDGIFEYQNPRREQFGEDRVSELMLKYQHEPMTRLLEKIVQEVERFAELAPQGDDMTMLLVRRLPA